MSDRLRLTGCPGMSGISPAATGAPGVAVNVGGQGRRGAAALDTPAPTRTQCQP